MSRKNIGEVRIFRRSVVLEFGKPKSFAVIVERLRIACGCMEAHRKLCGLLAETCLRVGELRGLAIDDVDLNSDLLVVSESAWRGKVVGPKTANSARVINLSSWGVEHMREFLGAWYPDEYDLLFATRNGTV